MAPLPGLSPVISVPGTVVPSNICEFFTHLMQVLLKSHLCRPFLTIPSVMLFPHPLMLLFRFAPLYFPCNNYNWLHKMCWFGYIFNFCFLPSLNLRIYENYLTCTCLSPQHLCSCLAQSGHSRYIGVARKKKCMNKIKVGEIRVFSSAPLFEV